MKNRKYTVCMGIVLLSVMTLISAAPAFAQEIETEGNAAVATAEEMTTVDDVVEDWMVPIPADNLFDGIYDIEVLSSSSMFQITSCQLIVQEGEMSAAMTMGGTGYLYLFPGTGLEAAAADEAQYIPFKEGADGKHTFLVPVKALDEGLPFAAFSKKKEKWYDRTLVFLSTSLDTAAFKTMDMTTVEDLGLEDGEYYMEASLSGGSGKASISSPARIIIEDGIATAEIIMSSKNYDYMIFQGEKLLPVNEEWNSTFMLTVPGFDYNMAVAADTVAMSQPHEIDYVIRIDSSTVTAE